MRRTTTLLATCLLLAGAAVGCSKSADEEAKECAAALTERTDSKSSDTPTVSEAKRRVDALDDTLAGMVDSGYADPAARVAAAVEKKTEAGGKKRPDACEPLSGDDYTSLLMAKAINGLGWTDGDGEFDKGRMADRLPD